MLKELLKNKAFNSAINDFYQKNKGEILDIILFGSIVRGKEKPSDMDILLLFKDKESLNIEYILRKNLEKLGYNVQITTKTYNNLFSKEFKARESFISEGYSLLRKQFIAEGLSHTNIMLFKYELNGFSQSKRMQLQYALYGRDKKSGIAKELRLNKFADTIFFSPPESSEKLREFFNSWGIKFELFPILIPQRIIF